MTALLEKAVHEISSLPNEQQDALASLILEEMESEAKWDKLFSESQSQLSKLASRAIEDYKTGKTTPWQDNGEI